MGAICRSWDKQQAKDREKKKEGNEREAKIRQWGQEWKLAAVCSVSEHRVRCNSVEGGKRKQQHQHIIMSEIWGTTRPGSITNWNPLNYIERISQHVWRGGWRGFALLGESNWFHCAGRDQSIPIKVIESSSSSNSTPWRETPTSTPQPILLKCARMCMCVEAR